MSDSIQQSRTFAPAIALLLGAVALVATQVSTLPGDLAFMLPAVCVLWFAVFAALQGDHPGGYRLSRWISIACWVWLVALAANPFVSLWPEMSIWVALKLGLIPASILGLHRWLADDAIWNRLEWLLFGVGTLVAVAMLCQYFVLGQRADGPFLDANVASAVLYAILLPLLYRLMTGADRPLTRWMLAASALLLAAGFFTAFSRAGLIVLTLALAATAVVVLAARQRAITRRFGLCLLLVAAGFAVVHYGPQQSIQRNWDDLSQDSSLDARFLMWQSTLAMAADAPVTGRGLGTYKLLYPRYRSLDETGTTGDMAHNDYLQVLAGGGPLLLALLAGFVLVVLGTALWLLMRLHGTRAGPDKTALLRDMGLCAALLALAVHATVNFIFFVLLLSLLTGLYAARLAGRYAIVPRTAPEKRWANGLRSVVRPIVGFVALYTLVTVCAGAVAVQTFHRDGAGGEFRVSMHSPAYRVALAIRHIDPLNYRARFYIGIAKAAVATNLGPNDAGTGLAVMALQDLRSLLHTVKHPDCSVQANVGVLLTAFRSQKTALQQADVWVDPARLLRGTVTTLPECMPAWLALAHLWAERDKPQRSIAVLKEATRFIPIATVKAQHVARLLTTLAGHLAKAGNKSKALEIVTSVLETAPGYQPAVDLLARLQGPDT